MTAADRQVGLAVFSVTAAHECASCVGSTRGTSMMSAAPLHQALFDLTNTPPNGVDPLLAPTGTRTLVNDWQSRWLATSQLSSNCDGAAPDRSHLCRKSPEAKT
ncbi:unnamed protein product [Phytophthora fragariaefolia]|uniref:Unnamed protein product n=1 Tax=Phytophthora fragariaefolia TaxID=1490495 RepID=A0A9W6WKM1_9STRA|nr:unnamed protein product [Phytophthora fragariaefolia]